jgi:two-component system, OmpR family, response regulator
MDTSTALRRILLVEDDGDIRAVAALALERVGGFEVETCASGAAALEAIGRCRPDLVLLDVMMPEMDGPGVLKRLHSGSVGRDLPVIMLTAKVHPLETARLRDLGAVDVIHKPFDPMALPAAVRAIWQRLGR